MPPVPTKPKSKHKSTRRDLEELGFDGSHAREIEQKRNSGQISCAECRRLKIKCDKQIPCQSCRRRGCAALCPNGSLSTGQGTRFVLAATEHLHRQIAKMSERIRQLEDALGELQARHSKELHPLLRPDLLGASQHDDDLGLSSAADPAVVERAPELVEALGTLSISDSGAPRFFGATGGSHCLLMSDNLPLQDFTDGSSDSARDSKSPELPHKIEMFIPAFPFKPADSTLSVEDLVNDCLPTWERACVLRDAYFEQASWLFQSVSHAQISEELLPAYYMNGARHVTTAGNNPHLLGLLFLVLAIGALLDPNQEPRTSEAARYHQVAHAAICLQSVMEKPSLETIQALHLLSIYNALSGNEFAGKETSMETSWSLVTLAAHLAHTLGLHRDSLRWGLSPKITERRRIVFWDLFVADVWNSLEAGRPPTFSLPYIDCQFPGGGSPHDKPHTGSDKQAFYGPWTLRFASDCVADVAARTLTCDAPSYSTILELDHKVRNFPVTEVVEEFVAAASGATPARTVDKDIGVMESMGRYVMSNAREVILLYIHRSYFAQAIIENPTNPLKSVYTPSFLAAYRASLTILHTVKAQYDLHPELTARLWPIWTYAFSAAIVFGTIVTRGPRSPMASEAMKELRDACILFSKASSYSRRAQKALPIITRLTEKAHNALLHAQSDMPNELGQQWGVTENEDNDELAIFAGRMKFVSIKSQATGGASERSPKSDGSIRQSSISPPVSPQKQHQVETSVPRPYGREQLGSAWAQQPGSAAGLGHSQDTPTWDRSLYPDASSQSALMKLPPASLQISPAHMPSHGGPIPGPSSRAWLSEPSNPYPMANLGAQGHSQGHHPHQHRYDQQTHYPLTPSTSSTVSSYYDHPLASTSAHHHQSGPQAYPSTSTHLYTQPNPHQPMEPLPCRQPPHQYARQPTHPRPHQPQPVPLAPPELAQLGLVAHESGLDQRWTSFMRESGFFDGYGYNG
ncbi:fungal-specific transcription factor domain-containing protein [Pisolithus orientalis]|uniref:fungal-specific transcription factor domain-containing protein n=1 Tax=Pisolithus orientalis TaxID=936130 RepID=UPI0022253F4E|nr:fungal-specific transcription factor domain-containing protein [Pisolithus orientalis]KAI5992271.1 fungal-specific transcription factor domain-containing protein [Pisolithus orientalis]